MPVRGVIPESMVADWRVRANASTRNWHYRQALKAYEMGHYLAIAGRGVTDLYMIRFWLTMPVLGADDEYQFADSMCLHHLVRADNDGALHDHPARFKSVILEGGYEEALPPQGWTGPLGPDPDALKVRHMATDVIIHQAADLHSITNLIGDRVWTMVQTGPAERKWGFHPQGRPWMTYRDYLAECGQRAAGASA